MTREEKIRAIYKEVANKERSIGCRINVKYRAYYHWETGGEVSYSKEDDLIVWVDWVASNGDIELNKSDLSEADPNWYIEDLETLVQIIGHPVMIGDALEVLDAIAANRDNARYERRLRDILMVWSKPRKPIDEQPDECIDLVYSLIQKD